MYMHISIYIYIYVYVIICICICVYTCNNTQSNMLHVEGAELAPELLEPLAPQGRPNDNNNVVNIIV